MNNKKFIAKVAGIEQLRVLSHDFDLRLVDESLQPDNVGLCNITSQSIVIRDDQHPQQLLCTILHEVVHIAEKFNQHEFTEQQVDAVALGMFSLFAENPKFRKLFDSPEVGRGQT